MSCSKETSDRLVVEVVEDVAARVDRLLESGRVMDLEKPAVRQLMTAAVRLYSAQVEASGEEFAPTTADVTTTDAVSVACALLRQQYLNPFDLALWFDRFAPKP